MTPQQLNTTKLALEALNSCGHGGDGWDQFYDKDKVKEALRMIYEMKEINDAVNVELERQINQLDSVY